jgi:hypothetical protein
MMSLMHILCIFMSIQIEQFFLLKVSIHQKAYKKLEMCLKDPDAPAMYVFCNKRPF